MSRPLELSDRCRAELCTGLGRALSAGLDPVRALNAVNAVCDGALKRPLAQSSTAVGNGASLSATMKRHGLVPELDYALLRASEDAGGVDRVLERLGERYTRSDARWRTMKGRLMLPGFIIVVAIVTLPIPALFAGRIGLGEFVFNTAVAIGALLACVYLIRALVAHWRAYGPPTPITRAARMLPGLGNMSRMHQRADVCDALGLSLASGITASDAVSNLMRGQRNALLRGALGQVRSHLEHGKPVADALRSAGIVDEQGGYGIVSAGEQAGRLAQSLEHYARGLHAELDDRYRLLAQWIPVIAYFSVAGVVAAGILG